MRQSFSVARGPRVYGITSPRAALIHARFVALASAVTLALNARPSQTGPRGPSCM